MQRYGLTIQNDVYTHIYIYIYIFIYIYVFAHAYKPHVFFSAMQFNEKQVDPKVEKNKGSVDFLCNFKYQKYPPEV